jgi:hypothetical protein
MTNLSTDGRLEFEEWCGAMKRMIARCRGQRLTEAESRELCLDAMRASFAAMPGSGPVPLHDYLAFIGLLFDGMWEGGGEQPPVHAPRRPKLGGSLGRRPRVRARLDRRWS